MFTSSHDFESKEGTLLKQGFAFSNQVKNNQAKRFPMAYLKGP
jgi:hypothetical protein